MLFCVYNYSTPPIFCLAYSYFYNLLLSIFPPYKDYRFYYLPYIYGISLLFPISLSDLLRVDPIMKWEIYPSGNNTSFEDGA